MITRAGRLAVGAFLLAVSGAEAQTDPEVLTLIHFGELARMYESGERGGLARVMTVIEEVRATDPHVVVTHSGGAISPSLMASFDQGRHMIDLLGRMGVDMMAIGNAEFDFGPAVAAERFAEAPFTILGGNILDGDGQPFPGTHQLRIIEVGPYKVGFFGLTTPTIGVLSSPGDSVVLPVLRTAARLAGRLREQGADLVVALAHLPKEEDEALVEAGVADVVLSGHDDQVAVAIDPGTRALFVEGGENGDWVTILRLTMTRRTVVDGLEFRWAPEFQIVDTSLAQPDYGLVAVIQGYLNTLSRDISIVVGETAVPLDTRREVIRFAETAFGNFVTDAMRVGARADVALLNSGAVRGNGTYGAGPLRMRDFLRELPFRNYVMVLDVDGQTLQEALENGVSRYESGSGRFPQVSGMSFTFDPALPAGSRVIEVAVGDRPLDAGRRYRLATLDFVARGGDGYQMLSGMPRLVDAADAPLLTQLLMDRIRSDGPISPAVERRIVVLP